MRPRMNARVATVLTAAGALSMTMFAATKAPASAPPQPDSQLAMTITDRTLAYGQSLVATGRVPAEAAGRRLALEFRPPGAGWSPAAPPTPAAGGRDHLRAPAQRSGAARMPRA